MNPEQTSSQPLTPSTSVPPIRARHHYIPNFASWLVGLLVFGVLLFMFDGGSRVQVKGAQTKALAQAKQIGLALRAYAADHDGNYPRAGLPEMLGAEPKDSNAAFAVLFPQYLTNESIFANKLSAYQTRTPDNVYDNPYTGHPVKTLEPGENVYSYTAGLTDKHPPESPLVFDGTDGTGHYIKDSKKRGGLWGGDKAIVVRLDNSAAVEILAGPDDARYIRRHGEDPKEDKGNLLDVSALGPGVRRLDPAFDRQTP